MLPSPEFLPPPEFVRRFTEYFLQVLRLGQDAGEAKGKVEALFLVLKARGLHVTPWQRERIKAGTTDAPNLDEWVMRAATVNAVEALFDGSP